MVEELQVLCSNNILIALTQWLQSCKCNERNIAIQPLIHSQCITPSASHSPSWHVKVQATLTWGSTPLLTSPDRSYDSEAEPSLSVFSSCFVLARLKALWTIYIKQKPVFPHFIKLLIIPILTGFGTQKWLFSENPLLRLTLHYNANTVLPATLHMSCSSCCTG